jgi:transcriptional regulator with XRE-family HTH domain
MLKPEQYVAIEYLSQVKNGGLSQDEIAEKCGVSRTSLYNWRQDDVFQAELRRQIARNTMNRLPEVMNAMVESAISLKSAAAAKLIMQACEMLTDHTVIDDKRNMRNGTDTEDLKERIKALKLRHNQSEELIDEEIAVQ